jgi:DNA-binding transcriptional LysR family regulator
MVPTLVSGSQMIALVQERFALAMADQTTLRLLEPPMPLQPTHQLMLWTSSAETDPGHTWLRRRIVSLVAELDETTGPQRKAGAPSRSSSRRPIPEQAYQGQA